LPWYKQSQKLFWLACPHHCGSLSLSVWGTTKSNGKHDINAGPTLAPHLLCIWEFRHLLRSRGLDWPSHGNWSREQCRTADLGSSKHALVWNSMARRFCCNIYLCSFLYSLPDGRFCLHQQHGSNCYQCYQWLPESSRKNVEISSPLAWDITYYWRRSGAGKMFMVYDRFSLEQEFLVIYQVGQ